MASLVLQHDLCQVVLIVSVVILELLVLAQQVAIGKVIIIFHAIVFTPPSYT